MCFAEHHSALLLGPVPLLDFRVSWLIFRCVSVHTHRVQSLQEQGALAVSDWVSSFFCHPTTFSYVVHPVQRGWLPESCQSWHCAVSVNSLREALAAPGGCWAIWAVCALPSLRAHLSMDPCLRYLGKCVCINKTQDRCFPVANGSSCLEQTNEYTVPENVFWLASNFSSLFVGWLLTCIFNGNSGQFLCCCSLALKHQHYWQKGIWLKYGGCLNRGKSWAF